MSTPTISTTTAKPHRMTTLLRVLAPSVLAVVAAGAHANDIAAHNEQARALVMPFMKQLSEANQKAITEGGPDAAIGVCRDIAPKLAGDISRQNGVKLTRVSLKTRNPLLGLPDAWEQKHLQELASRLAKGEKPDAMEIGEVVVEPAGKYFRYLKPIVLQAGCVTCHGTAEQIPDKVKTQLKQDYPHDQAIGYSPGMLRGAVSVKRPL